MDGRACAAFLRNPVDLGPGLLVAALLVLGAVGLVRRRGRVVTGLMIAPLAAQLLASSLGVLPLSGRLVLGYVPLILLLLIAAPTVARDRATPLIAAATLGVLAPGLVGAMELAASPLRFDELRPVMQQVAQLEQPGDLVFQHYSFSAAVSVYQRIGVPLVTNGSMYTTGTATSHCDDAAVLGRARASGRRVWFIGPTNPVEGAQTGFRVQSDRVRARLRTDGRLLHEIVAPGAEAILVALPAALPPGSGRIAGPCLDATRTR